MAATLAHVEPEVSSQVAAGPRWLLKFKSNKAKKAIPQPPVCAVLSRGILDWAAQIKEHPEGSTAQHHAKQKCPGRVYGRHFCSSFLL